MKINRLTFRGKFILNILIGFAIITVCYSILATHFLFQGMKEVISYDIHRIANNESPSKIYYISDNWQQQPQELRQLMPQEPNNNKLYQINIPETNNTESISSWIVYKFQNDFNTKYVSFVNNSTEGDLSNYRLLTPKRIFILLIFTAISLFLVIFFILWSTFKTMDKPIAALKKWANSLSIENLDDPIPKFVYPELDTYAELLHSNVKAISQTSERERKFLAYTSHELRTPLSIIISNTEILKYIIQQPNGNNRDKMMQAISRLDHYTQQLQGMSQAILWLDRGSDSIVLESVELKPLLKEVIQQNIKIIDNNPQIQLQQDLQECTLKTYRFPLQIVLNNIVKNAFQHTLKGNISIQLTANYLRVINTLTSNNQSAGGFGIGLELTRRLTEKLNIEYITDEWNNKFYSKLIFKDSVSS